MRQPRAKRHSELPQLPVEPEPWYRGGVLKTVGATVYQRDYLTDLLGRQRLRPPDGLLIGLHPRVSSTDRSDLVGAIERLAERRSKDRYAVMPVALGALSALENVADVSGYGGEQALKRVVDDYWQVAEAGRKSQTMTEILTAAARPSVIRAVGEFISGRKGRKGRPGSQGFGPLVHDFGLWCAQVTSAVPVRVPPALFPEEVDARYRMGREHIFWRPDWLNWAAAIYRAGCRRPEFYHALPAPVAFYFWAALMLTALRAHPEWLGCRLFLANRMASLRVVHSGLWFLLLDRNRTTAEELRDGPTRIVGNLLDYLGAAAGQTRWAQTLGKCRRPGCTNWFDARDLRYGYCGACRKLGVRVRSERYHNSPGYRKRRRAPGPTQRGRP